MKFKVSVGWKQMLTSAIVFSCTMVSACHGHQSHNYSYQPTTIDENELHSLELVMSSLAGKDFIAKYARRATNPYDATTFDIFPDRYESVPSDNPNSDFDYVPKEFYCKNEYVVSIIPRNFDWKSSNADNALSTLFNVDPHTNRVRVEKEDDDKPDAAPTPCIDGTMPSPRATS